MAFNPLQSISTGVSDTTQINAVIAALNPLLGNLATVYQVDSGSLSLTNVAQDVPSSTITPVTLTGQNGVGLFLFNADISTTVTTSNNLAAFSVIIDGASQPNGPLLDDRLSRIRLSCFRVAALSSGAHTIKLQASKLQAGGTFTLNGATLTVIVFDIP